MTDLIYLAYFLFLGMFNHRVEIKHNNVLPSLKFIEICVLSVCALAENLLKTYKILLEGSKIYRYNGNIW